MGAENGRKGGEGCTCFALGLIFGQRLQPSIWMRASFKQTNFEQVLQKSSLVFGLKNDDFLIMLLSMYKKKF